MFISECFIIDFPQYILLKIKLVDSDICTMCQTEKDSNHHMLINCNRSEDLWD